MTYFNYPFDEENFQPTDIILHEDVLRNLTIMSQESGFNDVAEYITHILDAFAMGEADFTDDGLWVDN